MSKGSWSLVTNVLNIEIISVYLFQFFFFIKMITEQPPAKYLQLPAFLVDKIETLIWSLPAYRTHDKPGNTSAKLYLSHLRTGSTSRQNPTIRGERRRKFVSSKIICVFKIVLLSPTYTWLKNSFILNFGWPILTSTGQQSWPATLISYVVRPTEMCR